MNVVKEKQVMGLLQRHLPALQATVPPGQATLAQSAGPLQEHWQLPTAVEPHTPPGAPVAMQSAAQVAVSHPHAQTGLVVQSAPSPPDPSQV